MSHTLSELRPAQRSAVHTTPRLIAVVGLLAGLVPEHAYDSGRYVDAFSAGTHEDDGAHVSIVAEYLELF